MGYQTEASNLVREIIMYVFGGLLLAGYLADSGSGDWPFSGGILFFALLFLSVGVIMTIVRLASKAARNRENRAWAMKCAMEKLPAGVHQQLLQSLPQGWNARKALYSYDACYDLLVRYPSREVLEYIRTNNSKAAYELANHISAILRDRNNAGNSSGGKDGAQSKPEPWVYRRKPKITVAGVLLLIIGLWFLRTALSGFSMCYGYWDHAKQTISNTACMNELGADKTKLGEFYRVENFQVVESYAERVTRQYSKSTNYSSSSKSGTYYLIRYTDGNNRSVVVSLFDPGFSLKAGNARYESAYVKRASEVPDALLSAYRDAGYSGAKKYSVFYEFCCFTEDEYRKEQMSDAMRPAVFTAATALFCTVVGILLVRKAWRKTFR